MPQCARFRSVKLESMGYKRYRVTFDVEGYADVSRMLEASAIAQRIRDRSDDHGLDSYHLFGVSDFNKLETLCNNLESKITIDLTPEVDFCFALGPYTLFEADNTLLRSEIGELVYRSKYQRNQRAVREAGALLLQFIQAHPVLSGCTAMCIPPKSQSDLPDIVGFWARNIANHYSWSLIPSSKIQPTSPQKNLDDSVSEYDAVERVKNSMAVANVPLGTNVLMLDDTLRSGGSLMELALVLRRAGASRVCALTVAKDAKFTSGGISLYKDDWE